MAIDRAEEGMSNMASPSSIPLYLINGVATVWDAQVAATLHCVHNISGLRAGTLPGVGSQNVFLGLPITLMQEETAYLVRQGIAHLVPVNPDLNRRLPSGSSIKEYNEARVARLRAQEGSLQVAEEQRSRMAKKKFEQGGQAAQAKREARAKVRAEKSRKLKEGGTEDDMFEDPNPPSMTTPIDSTSNISTNDPGLAEDSTDQPSVPVEVDSKSEIAIRGTHFHSMPIQPNFSTSLSSPITSIPHSLFPFPSTPREEALLATFTTLQQRGYRVGLGPRFGGEYLVYPGDYLRYHAHFTSQVLVNDEVIRPLEIVGWGRLGTGTKKAGLLCCWDESSLNDSEEDPQGEGDLDFYSLEWANFG